MSGAGDKLGRRGFLGAIGAAVALLVGPGARASSDPRGGEPPAPDHRKPKKTLWIGHS